MRKPLIFISHDSRDAKIAAAFADLLQGVTMSRIRSFRSSDSGGDGISSGNEVYPTIVSKIREASQVVCLLTASSYQRPWIYYEAGFAKGALDKTVHAIALGIPIVTVAAAGPFSQFQICSDDIESISNLGRALAREAGCNPPTRTVRAEVRLFLDKVQSLLGHSFDDPGEPVLLHHASVPVRDLQRSIEFYRDLLGLKLRDRPGDLLFRKEGAWFELPNGQQQVHLIENPDGNFRHSRAIDFNDVHFAIRVPDVGAARQRLRAARKRTKRNDDIEDSRYPHFYVLDPDLHVIEVNGDRIEDRTKRPTGKDTPASRRAIKQSR
jgi:catechol 2,3-dioxygenase-like lactoylglutathione lyase family enzyme